MSINKLRHYSIVQYNEQKNNRNPDKWLAQFR